MKKLGLVINQIRPVKWMALELISLLIEVTLALKSRTKMPKITKTGRNKTRNNRKSKLN